MKIEKMSGTECDLETLNDLLVDCVAEGASIGFLPPLSREEATAYWLSLNADIRHGKRILLACRSGDKIAGAVQLSLCMKKNGMHRAELEKLMVHPGFRRQGLGRLLLSAIEIEAITVDRWLIVLDTRVGDVASELYRSSGYTAAGIIPDFALSEQGTHDATCIFYKIFS